jgi:hypothetical protein
MEDVISKVLNDVFVTPMPNISSRKISGVFVLIRHNLINKNQNYLILLRLSNVKNHYVILFRHFNHPNTA